MGRALVARLRADGVRVLATARSYPSERAVIEAGAEPLHTGVEGLGSWTREIADVEVVYHLGLPRIEPPLRRVGARRRARLAATGAAALRAAVGERPVVMASTGLLYAATGAPAVDDDPADGRLALAQAARRRRDRAAGPGPAGGAPALGVRPNGADARPDRWPSHPPLPRRRARATTRGRSCRFNDAASALIAAAAAPSGTYTAAEGEAPTQLDVIVAHLRHARASAPGPRRAGSRRHRHGRRDERGPRARRSRSAPAAWAPRLGAVGRLAARSHAAGGGSSAAAAAVSGIDWVRVPPALS